MSQFPFLSKDDAAAPQPDTITVKREPKVCGPDDIAAAIVQQMPELKLEDVKQLLHSFNNRLLDILLSGRDVRMPDGSIYSLDADGRTIIIYPPENEP